MLSDSIPPSASDNIQSGILPQTEGLRPLSYPFTCSRAQQLRTGFRLEHDALPEGPVPLPPAQSNHPIIPLHTSHTPTQTYLPAPPQHQHKPFRTEPDIFGRYGVYGTRPVTIPDANTTPAPIVPGGTSVSRPARSVDEIIAPCPNISAFYVQKYHWLG